MPFTFSHPALILPFVFFRKKWYSLTGLIIGSMMPDFEYFFRMKIKSEISHTFWGVLVFDIPVGILLAFVFHNIVRDSLVKNLPPALKYRFSGYISFNWNRYFKNKWFIVLISLFIGILSHILWDSFTHPGGFFVERISIIKNTAYLFGNEIPVFKILQHGSSLLGAIIIVLFIWKLPEDKSVSNKGNIRYWFIVAFTVAFIVFLRLLTGLDYRLYGNLIVTIISAFMIALVTTPLIMRIICKNKIEPGEDYINS